MQVLGFYGIKSQTVREGIVAILDKNGDGAILSVTFKSREN
jgi:hypothetical protein